MFITKFWKEMNIVVPSDVGPANIWTFGNSLDVSQPIFAEIHSNSYFLESTVQNNF